MFPNPRSVSCLTLLPTSLYSRVNVCKSCTTTPVNCWTSEHVYTSVCLRLRVPDVQWSSLSWSPVHPTPWFEYYVRKRRNRTIAHVIFQQFSVPVSSYFPVVFVKVRCRAFSRSFVSMLLTAESRLRLIALKRPRACRSGSGGSP